MAQCTAPVQGHRTASAAANCPACRYGSRYRSTYRPLTPRYPSYTGGGGGGGPYGNGGTQYRTVGGRSVGFTAADRRTLDPVRRVIERQPAYYADRRDIFLCHAWPDRQGAAKELHDLLEGLGLSVWFSEKDVVLGTSLIREIDKGLSKCRIGIVLVTPALFDSLNAEGVADKELSALLATDRVIPVAHGTTFEALRDVSPLLAARSGLTTSESSPLADIAAKIADTVRPLDLAS